MHAASYPTHKNASEVQLFLGRSLLTLEGRESDALKALGLAAKDPNYIEEARLYAAEAYIKKNDTEKAANVLKMAIADKLSGVGLIRACLQLADLYIEKDELDKAAEQLKMVQSTPNYPDVIVAVNHRFVQIGDKHLDGKKYNSALSVYSSVKPHAQVVATQEDRLQTLEKNIVLLSRRLEEDRKANRNVLRTQEDQLAIMKATAEQLTKILAEVKALKEYDAVLRYRISRCYFNMERYWIATSAFESIYKDYPTFDDASTSLFGAVICHTKLNLVDGTLKLCSVYLEKYKDGKYVDQIAEIKASTLINQNRAKETIEFITKFLDTNPKTTNKEKFFFLLTNTRFSNSQYDEAAAGYDTLIKDYPQSLNKEDYVYRRALCSFLRNQYEETLDGFNNYEKSYPSGLYNTDIQYRRGIILLAQAAQEKDPKKQADTYENLYKTMDRLLQNQNTIDFRGQIYTLIADAKNAQGDNGAAATNYALAVKFANGDQNVIQYALEEATNSLKGNRRWTELRELWELFLQKNPGHAMELRGVSELCKLYIREQQEAKAKETLLTYVMKDIHNPRSEYVEMLLSQFASLYVPKRKVKVANAATQPAPLPPEKVIAEIMSALQLPEENHSMTYLARLQFVKAEYARMVRDDRMYKSALNIIGTTYSPESLSPTVLALVGNQLFEEKRYDEAKKFYSRLRTSYPDSYYGEAGPIGIGLIELQMRNFQDALDAFNESLSKPTSGMIKEATFGKGRALMGLGKIQEAAELFKEVIATKEWRGAEKAGAIYYMGEISAKQGDSGTAHGYFQRVYLSHAAYPEYAAKSYLRAVDMLRNGLKHDEARATLQELINHPKLKDTPEAKEAAKSMR